MKILANLMSTRVEDFGELAGSPSVVSICLCILVTKNKCHSPNLPLQIIWYFCISKDHSILICICMGVCASSRRSNAPRAVDGSGLHSLHHLPQILRRTYKYVSGKHCYHYEYVGNFSV